MLPPLESMPYHFLESNKLTRTPPAPSKLEYLSLCLVNCGHCFRLVSQDSFGISWKCCLFLSYYLINWVKSHLLCRFLVTLGKRKNVFRNILALAQVLKLAIPSHLCPTGGDHWLACFYSQILSTPLAAPNLPFPSLSSLSLKPW